jgi:hypothetical protein
LVATKDEQRNKKKKEMKKNKQKEELTFAKLMVNYSRCSLTINIGF